MDYPEHIKKRIKYIAMTFYMANKSISELKIILEAQEKKAAFNISQSSTIDFYGVTLQYCFISEFCKLTERKDKLRKKENFASIDMFLESCQDSMPSTHISRQQRWISALNGILENTTTKRIRTLRDKQFLHIDKTGIPEKIKYLEIKTIDLYLQQLREILEIIKPLTDFHFVIPHRDNRTKNFLNYQSNYKKLFFEKE